ncbi:MAG: ABC transporter ATP-binding protein [Acidobacteria bacterium]|nr:ABC transporter ATP-binding protein [Acidobacteriota bacterium]
MADHHEEEVLGKAYDSRLMRRMLKYLWPYKWYALTSLVLTIVSAPLSLAGPPLTKAAIDIFLAPDVNKPLTGFALFIKNAADRLGFGANAYQGIAFIAILFCIASILAFTVSYTQSVVMQKMGQYIMYDLRKEIFAKLQNLDVQYYDRNPVGRLMTRLTTDVDALNEMFTAGVIVIFGDLAMIGYIVIWMFQSNWQLALVSFSIVPLLVVLTTWFRLGARTSFRSVRTRIARINAFLQEHITGMPVVQLFNREEKAMRQFKEINQAHRKANIDTIFFYAVFYPAVEIVGALGIALIIWYGGGKVIQGVVTIGTLVAFIQLARSFYEPISDISEKYNILQAAMAASERIVKLLDEPVKIQSPATPVTQGRAAGRIEFRHVWFAYKNEDWILRDVSFTVEPGEKVAFVGHTGAGKTTITNLLLRFYEIQRGQIFLDDVDIHELDLQELRRNFSIVLQDVFLFSGNIADNIKLGTHTISAAQLQAASKEVHADPFIQRLTDGYQTEVRERGAGLSVGQKQLISFARALAHDPRVLILDEATSSIDTETELLIKDAVERLMEGRTSLVIAHRLSTIQSVDKIIVMHKGEIREQGTHQELLNERGLYWRLYQLQFYQDFKQEFAESVADD